MQRLETTLIGSASDLAAFVECSHRTTLGFINLDTPLESAGTWDKLEGQLAEAVVVSMATSSGDTLRHNIKFLYGKNRVSIAIPHARCLAPLVVNPALADISCSTVEQMGLVNTVYSATDHVGEQP